MTIQTINLNNILHYSLCEYFKEASVENLKKINDTISTFSESNIFEIDSRSIYMLLYLYNKNSAMFTLRNQGFLESLFYSQINTLLNERKHQIEKHIIKNLCAVDATSNCYSPI